MGLLRSAMGVAGQEARSGRALILRSIHHVMNTHRLTFAFGYSLGQFFLVALLGGVGAYFLSKYFLAKERIVFGGEAATEEKVAERRRREGVVVV